MRGTSSQVGPAPFDVDTVHVSADQVVSPSVLFLSSDSPFTFLPPTD